MPSDSNSNESLPSLEELQEALDSGNLQAARQKLGYQTGALQGKKAAAKTGNEAYDRARALIGSFGPKCLMCADFAGRTLVQLTALQCTDERAMQLILDNVGDDYGCLDASEPNGATVFYYAAQNPCVAALKLLVRELGPNGLRNRAFPNTYHPLLISARMQDQEAMALYMNQLGVDCFHAPVNSEMQRSAFHMAALNSNSSALTWLIENVGSDALKCRDDGGNTPVHLAAWIQGQPTIELIFKHLGYEMFALKGENDENVVHSAAQNPNTSSVLHWLIEKLSAQCLLTKDSLGRLPVHHIACYQDANCLKMAVKSLGTGCLSVADDQQQTVVHYAAMNEKSNDSLVWLVQQLGRYCLSQPGAGNIRPYHLAAWYQGTDSLILIKETLGLTAFSIKTDCGRTIAHYAAENYSKATQLDWIVANVGQDCLQEPDSEGNTPAKLASLEEADE